MDYHVNVLFKHDDKNRMTVVNEPPYDDAPRIFIGGTQQGNLIRYSSILSKSLLERLERVTSKDSGIQLGKIIGVLSVEQQINNFWVGPAFLFPDLIGKSTQTIQIT